MDKEFEKIIEKLEEEKMSYFLTIANTGDEKLDCTYEQIGNALDKAIEIVKQEAEQYETFRGDNSMKTTIGFLKHGDFFLLDGIKYKVGHLIENTNGYVACVDVETNKVKRFYVDTTVEIVKE